MYATTISDAAQFHLENMHQAVKSLGETITTSALYSITPELDFPFVTVPAWELYACHARQQAGLEGIAYTPIVTTANLANWSNYSVSNQNWIQQSRQIMLELSNDTQAGLGNHYVNTSILPMIYETTATGTEPVTGPGPFLPIWQSSPPPFDPQFINFDTMTRTSIKGIYPIVSLSRGTSKGPYPSNYSPPFQIVYSHSSLSLVTQQMRSFRMFMIFQPCPIVV